MPTSSPLVIHPTIWRQAMCAVRTLRPMEMLRYPIHAARAQSGFSIVIAKLSPVLSGRSRRDARRLFCASDTGTGYRERSHEARSSAQTSWQPRTLRKFAVSSADVAARLCDRGGRQVDSSVKFASGVRMRARKVGRPRCLRCRRATRRQAPYCYRPSRQRRSRRRSTMSIATPAAKPARRAHPSSS